jgi:hypothetical protein
MYRTCLIKCPEKINFVLEWRILYQENSLDAELLTYAYGTDLLSNVVAWTAASSRSRGVSN